MTTTDHQLKLENQLCFAFYACSREITKLYRPILAELGLTYTQYITLLALWEKDGVGVKELGERLYLDSGTLTPLLKKLETTGLLTRTRSKADERSVVIELTAAGRALKERAAEVPGKLYACAGLREEDLAGIRSQLQALLQRVDADAQADRNAR
ncbi:MarR family transcriptional regulator [Paenibacillus athensensis]|uniref:MarR family transcriptional regulator n=1 Tax=Paenibacillus athensensis TaxID=1967502 RepID=A0A4Y8PYW7_9BACL|nr:MarR family transcriptional regulator [Paenibacillus athensensis]MCD1260422.1 MarR family transcriptional regulator [Paenibacillus athensensis]